MLHLLVSLPLFFRVPAALGAGPPAGAAPVAGADALCPFAAAHDLHKLLGAAGAH